MQPVPSPLWTWAFVIQLTWFPLSCCAPADQQRLEAHISELRDEQKRLTSLLADKGAGPESAGEGLLRAMLQLKDTDARG